MASAYCSLFLLILQRCTAILQLKKEKKISWSHYSRDLTVLAGSLSTNSGLSLVFHTGSTWPLSTVEKSKWEGIISHRTQDLWVVNGGSSKKLTCWLCISSQGPGTQLWIPPEHIGLFHRPLKNKMPTPKFLAFISPLQPISPLIPFLINSHPLPHTT